MMMLLLFSFMIVQLDAMYYQSAIGSIMGFVGSMLLCCTIMCFYMKNDEEHPPYSPPSSTNS